MSDRVASLIRTVIPVWWGSLLAWLVSLGLPTGVITVAEEIGPLLVGLAIAIWYAIARWLESRLPPWLVRVLFGTTVVPEYHSVARPPKDLPAPEQGAAGQGTAA
ncbi:hypothetical protein [Actinoalloteichus hymeniacidonis]|uniref:Uncharacterized protein n=1 Tax=Actinoalloteichus hymeniacidonis TaxID=340345 RepID=A0AAC9HSY4_9PSEU|nr:hypothetical protein [Actinoalloteichus hymeniacidonis]AOS64764.1 hypothetical protein TL08_19865 [Actinoalloteichus hymeniacidonis]MBB5907160.1 hypothetical protein [Actinoalloteichus hymeniacidonis]